jgi:hypothetical protein
MNLGLDELMIVNPGPAPPRSSWFLGADGGLYRMDHPHAARRVRAHSGDTTLGGAELVPRYFLGDDGTLYETR